MLTQGALVRFRVYPDGNGENYYDFFLKVVETDESGMKMAGGVPPFWQIRRGAVFGPDLFWNEQRYSIAKMDPKRHLLWLLRQDSKESEMGV